MRAFVAGLLVATLSLVARSASANCTPGQLDYERAWPANATTGVPTSSRILLHRYGTAAFLSAPVAYGLVPDRGAPIALGVDIDLHSGSGVMQQRSLVLRPVQALAPRMRYTLVLRGMLPTEQRPQSFTTGAGPDGAPPVVRGLRARAFARTEFGCGPAEEIPIDVNARDDGQALWVRLRVAHDTAALRAGRIDGDMILPVENGRVVFGHEMCIGNWGLRQGQRFVAGASVMDASGHELPVAPIVLDAAR